MRQTEQKGETTQNWVTFVAKYQKKIRLLELASKGDFVFFGSKGTENPLLKSGGEPV